jgi:Ca2+-binding RTX toxin-like protein
MAGLKIIAAPNAGDGAPEQSGDYKVIINENIQDSVLIGTVQKNAGLTYDWNSAGGVISNAEGRYVLVDMGTYLEIRVATGKGGSVSFDREVTNWSHQINIVGRDTNGNIVDNGSFTVDMRNVNEAPTALTIQGWSGATTTPTGSEKIEHSAVGTIIGNLQASDADSATADLRYTFKDGLLNGTVSSDGVFKIESYIALGQTRYRVVINDASKYDYDSLPADRKYYEHTLIVTDTAGAGLSKEQTFRFVPTNNTADDVATTLAIAATSADKAEGQGDGWTDYTFTVTRSDLTGSPTADWSIALSGNLTAADFQATTGTVTFAAGSTTAVITVKVRADAVVEGDEPFTVTLSNATGATITTASAGGNIRNDDLPTLSIAATSADHLEGDEGSWTDYTFTVTRSDLTGSPTANWGIALAGNLTAADFEATTGTVTFAAGSNTAVITVRVRADAVVEANEAFTVTLSNANGATITTATANGTIQNDDLPTLSIAATSADKAEGSDGGWTDYTFTVTRSDLTGSPTANWSIGLAGSLNGDDFQATTGTVTFAAGSTTAIITVKVRADANVEGDEGFTVTLSNPTGATITAASANGMIRNDDGLTQPTLSIAATSADKAEGSDGGWTEYTFTVTRSDLTGSPTANWGITLAGSLTADDFQATTGMVTFAAGSNTAVIRVQVRADALIEANEAFTVTLSNPTGATIATGSATGTIRNDDQGITPNSAPTGLLLSNAFVLEYALPGAEIGTLTATDANGDALTYTLLDNAGGRFAIVGNKLVVGRGVNFEEAKSHQVKVQVSDGKGGTLEQVFTIGVGDQLTLNKRGKTKNEKLNGTNQDDILKGGGGSGIDTIKGLGGDDQLSGESGNDKLYGGDGIDVLKGGNGIDILKGDAGNDVLYGEMGNDKLYGGAGADTFVFNKKANKTTNYDRIYDFKSGEDKIYLENSIFKKLGRAGTIDAPAKLDASMFKLGKAKDKNDYLVYKAGVLYYDANGSRAGGEVEIVKLKGLKVTDIFII